MKKIAQTDITGERGVTLVRSIVLSMGCMFYETGGVEAGIDGLIEVRDEETGQVRNMTLQVQVKATTRKFPDETDDTFSYTPTERDLAYWAEGTSDVLLIMTRPDDGIAFWKSIKNWRADPENAKSKKIVFHKEVDVFTREARAAVVNVAGLARPGAMPPSTRRTESLIPNLVGVSFARRLWWAPTHHANNKAFGAALKEIDPEAPGEWVVKGGAVISFHDLDADPWRRLCDVGAMEEFDVEEWSESDDEDRQRDFVQLLNRALKEFVRPDVRFDRKENHYFFVKPHDSREVSYPYRSLTKWTTRRVVGRYGKKGDPRETAFVRHSAFWGRFARYGGKWYLEVNPTYRFTSNGYKPSLYAGDNLKKIKEAENNAAVMGQFVMWRHFLTARGSEDLYRERYPFMSFVQVPAMDLPYGVPDTLWKDREAGVATPLLDLAALDA
jgi:hypothetical protein